MATTEAVMGLTLPALNSDPGTWDTSINLSLERIPAHTHESGYGVRIKPGGLNIDSDLTFADNAATNLKAVNFFARASYGTNKSLWVNSATDDLYYRRAGTDHRLTVNGVLNLSLVGGITGDYAAASAALYYDDAADRYRFLSAAPLPNIWSYVGAGGYDLYEHASGISNFIGLRSPAALAASYNLTLPGALPGSTVLAQVSSAGAVTFTNTIVNTVTMTGGTHVIVSGAGRFKHGDDDILIPIIPGHVRAGTPTIGVNGTSTGAGTYMVPIELPVGKQIKSMTLYYNRGGAGTIQATYARRTGDGAGANLVTIAGTLINAGTGWTTQATAINHTTLAAWSHWIEVITDNAATLISRLGITFDHP
jgi:hypothetical protein